MVPWRLAWLGGAGGPPPHLHLCCWEVGGATPTHAPTPLTACQGPCMETGPALPLSDGAPTATQGVVQRTPSTGLGLPAVPRHRGHSADVFSDNPEEPMIVGLHLFSWPFTKRLLRNVLTVGSGVWNPVTGVRRAGCGAGTPRAPRRWASQGRPWRAALHPEQGVLGRARKVLAPSEV